MNMTGDILQAAVTELPHYSAYQENLAAVNALDAQTPSQVDERSADNLQAQTDLLDAREALLAPKAWLKVDIAEARETIPLAYRLGMLAAIDRPVPKLNYAERLITVVTNLPHGFTKDVPVEEFIWPPSDPFERAVMIGNVILQTGQAIRPNREVLMARLSTRYQQTLGSRGYVTESAYYMTKRNGFQPTEPAVLTKVEGPAAVRYSLPKITAQEVDYSPKVLTFKTRGTKGKEIEIPHLQQLMGDRYAIAKLVFGRVAVTKLALRLHNEREDRGQKAREFDEFVSTARF
jgi:hypothetical protein